MASKKTKAQTADDNLDELFEGIGDVGDDSRSKKPSNTAGKSKGASKAKADDPLADLESQLASEQASSRPHTPRLKETAGKRSTATPPTVDDKAGVARKSTDSARSLRASFTPSATSSELHESEKKGTVEQAQQAQESGSGWWGGWISTATATANAAMKQAEAAYKEIQQNEEAKKWADQVKGLRGIDVGALRTYGEPTCIWSKLGTSQADNLQAMNSANVPCRPLPTSFTPSPRPSRRMSVSSSTSPTTSSATPPSTP